MGGIDSPYVTLSCGIRMPAVGLGTWSLKGSAGIDAMLKALELGYRLLDTATYYRNEREVGEAVRQSGIPREEIFITTKIYPTEYGRPDEALEGSLDRLGLGYADMAMLHHPAADDLRAWGAIERAIAQGEARCGGLSCYSPSQPATSWPASRCVRKSCRTRSILTSRMPHPCGGSKISALPCSPGTRWAGAGMCAGS